MPALNISLWRLLLPSPGAPLLFYGTPPRELGERAGCVGSGGSASAGSAGVLVRTPDGPSSKTLLPEVAEHLRKGGAVVWIEGARQHSATARHWRQLQANAEVFCVTFKCQRNTLVVHGAHWVRPVATTAKLDLALRVLARLAGGIPGAAGALCSGPAITILQPGSDRHGLWLFDLAQGLAERRFNGYGKVSVGRIDRLPTDAIIAQLLDGTGGLWALKVATNHLLARRMQSEVRNLELLRGYGELPPAITSTLPQIAEADTFEALHYRLDRWLPGTPGGTFMYRLQAREAVIDLATDWITELHRATRRGWLSGACVAQHAYETLLELSALSDLKDGGFARRTADLIARQLDKVRIPRVFCHGDFWLGNVLIDQRKSELTGILDWDRAAADAAPLGDLLHLLAHRKWLFSGMDPGGYLNSLLRSKVAARDHDRIGKYCRELDIDPQYLRVLVLIYWVNYLATRKDSPPGSPHRWFRRAYGLVRRTVDEGG